MKMGCFLACFGYTKKRKRRKPGNKVQSTDQVVGSYVAIDFEKLDASDFDISTKHKEESSVKIKKKKVRFNLSVKTYEPLQQYEEMEEYFPEGEEKTKWEYSKEATKVIKPSYPSNYRYYNSVEEEEGEMEFEESDLEFEEIDDYYDEEDCSVPMKTENEDALSGEDKWRNQGLYASSVLNPIENVIQWKEAKARERAQVKTQKENIRTEQEGRCPLPSVEASLSNWLISYERKHLLKS